MTLALQRQLQQVSKHTHHVEYMLCHLPLLFSSATWAMVTACSGTYAGLGRCPWKAQKRLQNEER